MKEIVNAIIHEMDRQKATTSEREQLGHAIQREMRAKVMESGMEKALWSTPLTVENSLRRHREREAAEKRRQERG